MCFVGYSHPSPLYADCRSVGPWAIFSCPVFCGNEATRVRITMQWDFAHCGMTGNQACVQGPETGMYPTVRVISGRDNRGL